MRNRKSRLAALLAVGALATTGVAIASPAYALGSATYSCSIDYSVAGNSNTTSANTVQTASGGCGQVKLRIGYYAPGGVNAYTGWSYGSKSVAISGSSYGSIFAGNHGATDAGLYYPNASYFTT